MPDMSCRKSCLCGFRMVIVRRSRGRVVHHFLGSRRRMMVRRGFRRGVMMVDGERGRRVVVVRRRGWRVRVVGRRRQRGVVGAVGVGRHGGLVLA